MPDLILLIN